MILSDYHVHTSFSTDSTAAPAAQIEALIAKGITEICITDHHDIGYHAEEPGDFSTELPFRLNPYEYYQEILRLSQKYSSQARISIGVELGLRPDYHHSIEDFAELCDWDFIIGSTHVVDGIDPYYPAFWKGQTKQASLLRYFQATLENLEHLDCFDVYGHLDYIVRYAPDKTTGYRAADYQDVIDEILKKLIAKGKGLECNTAGLRHALPETNPCRDILTRYRELGGEILTIGSDGHKPEHLAYCFRQMPEYLSSCGFRYYTVFHNRKPEMLPL